MTIKGLTDRNMAFPEIGQIRKGAPKEANAPGKDLQFFRVTFDERETEANTKFLKLYGDKPQEINILLPFDEIERCWEAWLEAYTAGRMIARSDGEKFIYLVDTKTGEIVVKNSLPYKAYHEGEVVGTYKSNGKEEKVFCKPTGRLKVILPELQRLAYLVVLTTSIHDIANISAQLEGLKQINGGRLAGIPMVLRRRPKKISTPKADGTRARYSKWMLSIEADPEWVKAKLLEVKHLALPANGLDLLPAGDQVIDVEARNIEAEQPEIEEEIEEEIPSDPEMDDSEQATLFPEVKTDRPRLKTPMSIEMAEKAKSSDGRFYKDLTDDELAQKRMGHISYLNNKANKDADQITAHKFSMDAIVTIEAYRKANAS